MYSSYFINWRNMAKKRRLKMRTAPHRGQLYTMRTGRIQLKDSKKKWALIRDAIPPENVKIV